MRHARDTFLWGDPPPPPASLDEGLHGLVEVPLQQRASRRIELGPQRCEALVGIDATRPDTIETCTAQLGAVCSRKRSQRRDHGGIHGNHVWMGSRIGRSPRTHSAVAARGARRMAAIASRRSM